MRFEPARYYDKHGVEDALIESDGRWLDMTVRGVKFTDRCFDSFDIVQDESNLQHPSVSTFSFWRDSPALTEYSLECFIPVVIQVDGVNEQAQIQMRLGSEFMNEEYQRGCYSDLELELFVGESSYKCRSKDGYFEDALVQITSSLPSNMKLQCCFTCALSDYSPYGNGMFGGLACFRDVKSQYLGVHGKGELFQVWDSMTEFVQETYLCPEYSQREPNSGYRG